MIPPPDSTPVVRRSVLENGLTVVTEAVPGQRATSLAVVIDAGPRQESPGREGLAHLTEHLLFAGTASRDAAAIGRLIDSAGGYLNGFTARDYTCFHATVLDHYSTYALDLLGDILLNSTFPVAAVEREKEIILDELLTRRDAPMSRVEELVKQHAWPGHALGRALGGSPESLARLEREDVIYFVHQHYLPQRMWVVASGGVVHEDFTAQVRDAFWRLLPGDAAGAPAPAPGWQGGLHIEERPNTQAYFALALPAERFAGPERYRWHLFNAALGGGLSSRLYRELREEAGLVYGIDAELHAYRDAGTWLITGATRPQLLGAVLERLTGLFDDLTTGRRPLGADEQELALRRLTAQHWLSGTDSATRMTRMCVQELYFGRHVPSAEVVAGMAAVTPDALGEFSTTTLAAARRELQLAVITPDSGLNPLIEARFATLCGHGAG